MPRASAKVAMTPPPSDEPIKIPAPPKPPKVQAMHHHHVAMGLLVVLATLTSGVVSLSAFAQQGGKVADNVIIRRLNDRLSAMEKKVDNACNVPRSPLSAVKMQQKQRVPAASLSSLEEKMVSILKKIDQYCGSKKAAEAPKPASSVLNAELPATGNELVNTDTAKPVTTPPQIDQTKPPLSGSIPPTNPPVQPAGNAQ